MSNADTLFYLLAAIGFVAVVIGWVFIVHETIQKLRERQERKRSLDQLEEYLARGLMRDQLASLTKAFRDLSKEKRDEN